MAKPKKLQRPNQQLQPQPQKVENLPLAVADLNYERLAATRARGQVAHMVRLDDEQKKRLQQRRLAELRGAAAAVAHLNNPGGRKLDEGRRRTARLAIEARHRKYPADSWLTATKRVAEESKENVRYVRRAGEAAPSLRW